MEPLRHAKQHSDAPKGVSAPKSGRPSVRDTPITTFQHASRSSFLNSNRQVSSTPSLPSRRQSATNSLERVEPQSIGLTAGFADASGVIVKAVRLSGSVGEVRISKSAGVLVGDHTRQLNDFRYLHDRPEVSADSLLAGHPVLKWAFARLVENPGSALRNFVFRQCLPGQSPSTPGTVRFMRMSGPPQVRVSARLDQRGQIVVDRSMGVQVGDRSTQHNCFSYRVHQGQLPLGLVLQSCPDLARSLAMTIRHPENQAVQRSFTSQLIKAYGKPSQQLTEFLAGYRKAAGLAINRASGVQIGSGGRREDGVSVDARRIVLTGLEATARRVTPQMQGTGQDGRRVPDAADRSAVAARPDSFGQMRTDRSRRGRGGPGEAFGR
jgi:hypothetical protein